MSSLISKKPSTDYGVQPYVQSLRQDYKCSQDELQQGRMVQNNSRGKASMFFSPTLFNIFLIQIMSGALVEHNENARVGSRNITGLRFADDKNSLAEKGQETEALVESLDKI